MSLSAAECNSIDYSCTLFTILAFMQFLLLYDPKHSYTVIFKVFSNIYRGVRVLLLHKSSYVKLDNG